MAIWTLASSRNAGAIAPPYVSDEELAGKAVIVVGRWDKSPFAPRRHSEGNVLKKLEVHTDFVIERVIVGDVNPGRRQLLLHAFLGWRTNGGPVMSYTSTEMMGDVSDVTQSNLWLLSWSRSWDSADTTNYLTLDAYRGVQPLALEPYFLALRLPDRASAVAGLLMLESPLVTERALEFIHGGTRPWPYWSRFDEWHRGKPDERKKLFQYADSLVPLLTNSGRATRQLAAAVYASLRDKASVPQMRKLLKDPDGDVRAIAVGTLAKHKDAASIESMNSAAAGITDAMFACAAIGRLAKWRDERLVPALIQFLENDGFGGQHGDDVAVPALKANEALKAIANFAFPFDVKASEQAWDEARMIRDTKERSAALTQRLGEMTKPFVAKLVRKEDGGAHWFIRVTNVSGRHNVIAKAPADIEMREENSLSSYSGDADARKTLIRLAPGESTEFAFRPRDRWNNTVPKSARIRLLYRENGSATGAKAWMGWLEAAHE